MKRKLILMIILLLVTLVGCTGDSEPTPKVLEKALMKSLGPAMTTPMKVGKIEILGKKGNWVKARIVIEGTNLVEYFFFEKGAWNYCNLVGGMDKAKAERLKIPKSLWEDLK